MLIFLHFALHQIGNKSIYLKKQITISSPSFFKVIILWRNEDRSALWHILHVLKEWQWDSILPDAGEKGLKQPKFYYWHPCKWTKQILWEHVIKSVLHCQFYRFMAPGWCCLDGSAQQTLHTVKTFFKIPFSDAFNHIIWCLWCAGI